MPNAVPYISNMQWSPTGQLNADFMNEYRVWMIATGRGKWRQCKAMISFKAGFDKIAPPESAASYSSIADRELFSMNIPGAQQNVNQQHHQFHYKG